MNRNLPEGNVILRPTDRTCCCRRFNNNFSSSLIDLRSHMKALKATTSTLTRRSWMSKFRRSSDFAAAATDASILLLLLRYRMR